MDLTPPLAGSRVWSSETSLPIPTINLVTFAFGRSGGYDANKPIFIDARDPSNFITTSLAQTLVRKLCKGLKSIGLQDGDCVTVHTYNNILTPVLFLGIIAAGGVVSGSNPAYTPRELSHHFAITNTKYLFVHNDCLETGNQREHAVNGAWILKESGLSPDVIFRFDDETLALALSNDSLTNEDASLLSPAPLAGDLQRLFIQGSQDWQHNHEDDNVSQMPAIHATTSGTTGLPKAAVIPHQYLVAQAVMLENQYESRIGQISQLITLPVFHTFAAQLALVLPLRLGISTYFLPRFHLEEYIDCISRFRITDTPVVPPIISSLVQHAKRNAKSEQIENKLQSLRNIICAGAPLSLALQSQFYEYLSPQCYIRQCWGTTEVGWVTLCAANQQDQSSSVGHLTANTRLKLLTSAGAAVTKEGEEGEACIRSPSTYLGYRNASSSDLSVDAEGFYHTGDIAYYQDNKVFVKGRIKDIMKIKAWQVAPQEVENVILEDSRVTDCAVVGVAHEDEFGMEETLVRAYVVPHGGQLGDEDLASAIETLVSSELASYKRLTGGVVFVNGIPRNPTGKILRWKLLEGEPTD